MLLKPEGRFPKDWPSPTGKRLVSSLFYTILFYSCGLPPPAFSNSVLQKSIPANKVTHVSQETITCSHSKSQGWLPTCNQFPPYSPDCRIVSSCPISFFSLQSFKCTAHLSGSMIYSTHTDSFPLCSSLGHRCSSVNPSFLFVHVHPPSLSNMLR